ncbi:uncharacterized protein (TIRG00374 family) [Parabacteroides sp. PF5-5]|uniref:lysylphosphatidylglycerol synthase transmembrane domain-containing protein n=1 Tax=unclassified Parabacteroides TaxID=2649774 RepID=UPI002475F809|nr:MULTISPECIES: lysylphosphatidylglycerol synthase transmembrane domain-containing protein [unclassified Parabacteroides]MDH6303521.1 uncharacterized protein (TIRG00374 family) [Parabacteroides sp. PH5-39]MDH6314843.1 uncharacterized protein (TIRG00374 family) [Parabacteroides sp. PF5-13]MDH6318180.1 uncharacterized protein (TIRG00374 family) [Parabacteroides sp. PH5-13]MDH6321888.1 uncharacterized protein (TIRG00374 family) [Parabacteroides sp. PH5-8]MDH6326012.1 uncharacterized protein (TIR
MAFKKILRKFVKVIFPLLIGFLLLWFLYREMDFKEIWLVVKKGVRYDILLLSLLFGLLGNVVRGFRWGLLISSLGEKFKMSNLIYAVLGNYTVNLVLPRVGEVWRCGVIAKYEKIPFTKLFGTLLIDRVADTVTVGLLAFLIFVFNISFFQKFLARNPELLESFQNNFSIVWIILGIVILVAAVWYTFSRLSHIALVQKAKGMLSNVWEGMKSVWLIKYKFRFILETLMIWGSYFLYFYIAFFAFDFTRDLGLDVGLIAFTMSSIGVAVPIQGAIGPWHFMVIATLVIFGVNENDAAAFALVVHTIQSVIWTGLCGLVGIIALPLTNKTVETTEK